MDAYFVYILANKKSGTIYIGVTCDLVKRINEHKNKIYDGFTKRYAINRPVYYEGIDTAENAMHREKRLKKYTRAAKIKLIEKENQDWNDLYGSLQ